MKIKKLIFFSMGFMVLCQQVQASVMQEAHPNALARLPQDAFNVQADNMSFKDLYALSQTSKEDRAKVKKYFEFKENIFKNTKCPILTKEKIINLYKKEEQKKGLRSFLTKAQSRPADDDIVPIDGVNWLIDSISIKVKSNEFNNLNDDLELKSGYTVVHNGKRQKESGPDDPFRNLGKFQVHSCSYSTKKGRMLVLVTELESLVFDEVAPVAH